MPGPGANAAALLEEEARLLAGVQAVLSGSAVDAAGAEERLKVLLSMQFVMSTLSGLSLAASSKGRWSACLL